MRIEKFEDIKGWQEARSLTRKIYELVNKLPFKRDRGLCGQIQADVDFQETYNQTRKTKSLINGFIKYLKSKK